jgi:hypothetical protein
VNAKRKAAVPASKILDFMRIMVLKGWQVTNKNYSKFFAIEIKGELK